MEILVTDILSIMQNCVDAGLGGSCMATDTAQHPVVLSALWRTLQLLLEYPLAHSVPAKLFHQEWEGEDLQAAHPLQHPPVEEHDDS